MLLILIHVMFSHDCRLSSSHFDGSSDVSRDITLTGNILVNGSTYLFKIYKKKTSIFSILFSVIFTF